jgi:hypothetical protein
MAVAEVQIETQNFKELIESAQTDMAEDVDDGVVEMPSLCPRPWSEIQTALAKEDSFDGFKLTNIGKGILPTQPGFLPTMMVDATNGILAIAFDALLPM